MWAVGGHQRGPNTVLAVSRCPASTSSWLRVTGFGVCLSAFGVGGCVLFSETLKNAILQERT